MIYILNLCLSPAIWCRSLCVHRSVRHVIGGASEGRYSQSEAWRNLQIRLRTRCTESHTLRFVRVFLSVHETRKLGSCPKLMDSNLRCQPTSCLSGFETWMVKVFTSSIESIEEFSDWLEAALTRLFTSPLSPCPILTKKKLKQIIDE
jgi:hypothetical protein